MGAVAHPPAFKIFRENYFAQKQITRITLRAPAAAAAAELINGILKWKLIYFWLVASYLWIHDIIAEEKISYECGVRMWKLGRTVENIVNIYYTNYMFYCYRII